MLFRNSRRLWCSYCSTSVSKSSHKAAVKKKKNPFFFPLNPPFPLLSLRFMTTLILWRLFFCLHPAPLPPIHVNHNRPNSALVSTWKSRGAASLYLKDEFSTVGGCCSLTNVNKTIRKVKLGKCSRVIF